MRGRTRQGCQNRRSEQGFACMKREAPIKLVSSDAHRDLAGIESVTFYDRIGAGAPHFYLWLSDHRVAAMSRTEGSYACWASVGIRLQNRDLESSPTHDAEVRIPRGK